MNYYTRVFQNYTNFTGRDSRKQYWMFVLFNIIIDAIIGIAASILCGSTVASGIQSIYGLVLLIPTIAIDIRRMHDIGKSGWWILIALIPLIGWIWFIVLVCQPSQPGVNQYGEPPID